VKGESYSVNSNRGRATLSPCLAMPQRVYFFMKESLILIYEPSLYRGAARAQKEGKK